MTILLLMLSMVFAALWNRVQTLTARLGSPEFAGVGDGSASSTPPDRIAADEVVASVSKSDPVGDLAPPTHVGGRRPDAQRVGGVPRLRTGGANRAGRVVPLVPAVMMLALAPTRRDGLTPALIVTAMVSLGWAAEPLFRSWGQAVFAASGVFGPVDHWPSLADAGLRLDQTAGHGSRPSICSSLRRFG